MALTQVPVKGSYVWSDGSSPVPAGTVTFTAAKPVYQAGVLQSTTKTFTLSNGVIPDGSWVYALHGDSAVAPSSNYYIITENIAGRTSTENRDVHRSSPTVDLGTGTVTVDASPTAAPRYAGLRPRKFDAARSLYGADSASLLGLRAATARGFAATALARLAWITDSYGSGPPGTASGSIDAPSRLADMLAAEGYRVGEQINVWNNATVDFRVTKTGTWNNGDRPGGMAYLSSTGAGNTVTVSSQHRGSVVEIITRGDTAAFTVSIDGAAAAAITPAGGSGPQVVSYAGLSDTVHTVTINSVTGTNYVRSVNVRPSLGLSLENGAISGSDSRDWVLNTSTYGPLPAVLSTTPHVVFIELCGDVAAGGSVSTYKSNLTALVTAAQSIGSSVVLVASQNESTSNVATALFEPLLSAVYDVADAKSVPLLDINHLIGTYATYSSLGLNTDTVGHLSGAGASLKATAIRDLLGATAVRKPAPRARTVRRTTGQINAGSATWVDIDTSTDLVLGAQAGDWVEVSLSCQVGSENQNLYMDAVTVVAGSAVNALSTGSAEARPPYGQPGWSVPSGYKGLIAGSVLYQLQAADVVGGQVRIRLRYSTDTATPTKAVYSSTGAWPLIFSAKVI